MDFYEANYPSAITIYIPFLVGIGLILFFYSLNEKVNLFVPLIPILFAIYFFLDAETKMDLTTFNNYFIDTYGPYLLILTALWGVVFSLHTLIASSITKKNDEQSAS